MKCLQECIKKKKACSQSECRHWIDYEKDLNCVHQTVDRCGPLTLRETAERLKLSFVRVKQIEDAALKKLIKKCLAAGLDLEQTKDLLDSIAPSKSADFQ
jgi:hypothetical protein